MGGGEIERERWSGGGGDFALFLCLVDFTFISFRFHP